MKKRYVIFFTILLFTLLTTFKIYSFERMEYIIPDLDCTVSYVIRDDWGTGATVDVSITNNGIASMKGWMLSWSFPGNQRITNLWSGTLVYSQIVDQVQVKNLDYNEVIPGNGGNIVFGFNLDYTTRNSLPAAFEMSAILVEVKSRNLPGADWTVDYIIRDDWKTGATVDITITNKKATPITPWELKWDFPGNQKITNFWNGRYTQNNTAVTVKNLITNAAIPANGGKVQLGFNLSYSGVNNKPAGFLLNGAQCMNQAVTIECQGLSVAVPDSAAPGGTLITITPLSTLQLNELPEGIPNITGMPGSKAAGYEVKVLNQENYRFYKNVNVSIHYDESKLTGTMKEENIYIYYYDETSNEWIALKRVMLDTVNNVVTCETDHFCRMFAGAGSALPGESFQTPQSSGLNTKPTNISGVDPLAETLFITPPVPNNKGTAEINFPIKVPEGINKQTPQVQIMYSSEINEGNCGLGWNLAMSCIAMDISKNIPRYDGTDQMLLDGKKIVSIGDNTYRLQADNTFQKIVKEGNSFTVYNIDGSLFKYGLNANSRLYDNINPSHTAAWYISKSIDVFGNEINYEYYEIEKVTGTDVPVPDNSVRLKSIKYGYNGAYSINFTWVDAAPNNNNIYPHVNCRFGFMVTAYKKIQTINILYKDATLRTYSLDYKTGAFEKQLLKQITEKWGGYNTVNLTDFFYSSLPDTDEWFSDTISTSVTPLSNYDSLQVTNGQTTMQDFVDVNGDNLPDRVYKDWLNKIGVQYNTGNGFTDTKWTDIPSFSNIKTEMAPDFLSRKEYNSLWFNIQQIDQRDWMIFTSSYSHITEKDIFYLTSPENRDELTRIFKSVNYFYNWDIALKQSNIVSDDNNSLSESTFDFIDINGDGFPDRVLKHFAYGPGLAPDRLYVQFNRNAIDNALSFNETTSYSVPGGFLSILDNQQDNYLRTTFREDNRAHMFLDLIDIDGDGWLERIAKHFNKNKNTFYIQDNNGDSYVEADRAVSDFFTSGEKFALRYMYYDDNNKKCHQEFDLVDLNGDGLPDMVYKNRKSDNLCVQYNTGTGFTGTFDPLFVLRDLIPDREDEDLRYIYNKDNESHVEIDFTDFNGDGLPDRIAKHRDNNVMYVQFNLGWKFTSSYPIRLLPFWKDSNKDIDLRHTIKNNVEVTHTECDFIDINGDGLPDRVGKKPGSNYLCYQLNQTGNPNRLTSIECLTGRQIDLHYEALAPQIGQYNKRFVLKEITTGIRNAVSGVIIDSGKETVSVTYNKPVYDYVESQFLGFEQVNTIVRDKENYSQIINETNYQYPYTVNSLGQRMYNPYVCGTVESVRQYLVSETGQTAVLNAKNYFYDTIDLFSKESTIKFTYCSQTTRRIYSYSDWQSTLLSKDRIIGDPVMEHEVILDNQTWLPEKTITKTYQDPFSSQKDIIITTDYAINGSRWISKIYKRDIRNGADETMLMETFCFDNLEEGKIEKGIITSEKKWNSNKDEKESVTVLSYDHYGNIASQVTPDGVEQKFSVTYPDNYEFSQVVVTQVPAKGFTETKKFDTHGKLKEIIDRFNDKAVMEYDDSGRLISVIEDVYGIPVETKKIWYTSNLYDDIRCYTAAVSYLNNKDDYIVIQYLTDALGREIQTKTESEVDVGDHTEVRWVISGKAEYDSMGRVTKKGSSKTVSYNTNALPVDIGMIEPVTVYTYDECGRLSKVISPTGITVEAVYNRFKEIYQPENHQPYERIINEIVVTATEDFIINETRKYYDMGDQLVREEVMKPDNTYVTTEYYYDLLGFSYQKRGAGSSVKRQVDFLGRLKETESADAGKTVYAYNSKGLLESKTELGRNESELDKKVTTYEYNESTSLLEHIKHYTYNNNEPISNTVDDLDIVYYPKDASDLYTRSRIKQINKGNGFEVSYNYGQLWVNEKKKINNRSFFTIYYYDYQSRISSVVYPDGELVRYSYNKGGLLCEVAGEMRYMHDIRYDRTGQRTQTVYGNGTVMTYQYDKNNIFLDTYLCKDKNNNEFFSAKYTFNSMGNITSIATNINSALRFEQTYQYDTFSNTLSASTGEYYDASGKHMTYYQRPIYDDQERITYNLIDNTVYDYEYLPGTNAVSRIQMTDFTGINEDIEFTYDNFGNRLRKEYKGAHKADSQVYTYDHENHIKTVSGNCSLSFEYDHVGQRIKKSVFNDSTLIEETIIVNGLYSVSSGKHNKHYSDGQSIIASCVKDSPESIVYYHHDYKGSTHCLTNSTGKKISEYRFYPYGQLWIADEKQAPGTSITRLFTGHEYDVESGLYYMNARYYDPLVGAFLSVDPAKQGLNYYAYCRNNPVMYTDPSGNEIVTVCVVVGGAILGAYIGGSIANDSFNPLAWENNSETWYAMGAGAILGAAAGYAIAGSIVAAETGIVVAGSTEATATTGSVMVSSAFTSAALNMGIYTMCTDDFTWKGLFKNGMIGLVAGAIGGAVSSQIIGPAAASKFSIESIAWGKVGEFPVSTLLRKCLDEEDTLFPYLIQKYNSLNEQPIPINDLLNINMSARYSAKTIYPAYQSPLTDSLVLDFPFMMSKIISQSILSCLQSTK